MRIIHVLTCGLLILLLSCGKPESSKIVFEGQSFELPINVKMGKEKLELRYEYYSGFFRGNVNDKSIDTQLEDYPVFMGSDMTRRKATMITIL